MSKENALQANERLREERLRRGWSQQKLADQLGIAVVTVNRWERGKQQPTGYYRLKLMTLFEKSAEELGLVEEIIEPDPLPYVEELRERTDETVSTLQIAQEDPTKDSSQRFDKLILEKETPRLSLSPNTQLGIPLLYRRKRKTLFLLLALLLLVIPSTTFFLVHANWISLFPTSRSTRSSTRTFSVPFTVPSTWKEVDDPLTKAHHNTQWTDDNLQCIFHSDGYYAISQGTNYCNYGDDSINNFSDIAYSIDILFYKGNMGGLIFRLVDNNYYGFYITTTGKYCILWHTDNDGGNDKFLVAPQSSSAIIKGLQQKNTLSILAQGPVLQFWINGQEVKILNNTTYKRGTIGVFTGDPTNDSKLITAALFRNAKVWTP